MPCCCLSRDDLVQQILPKKLSHPIIFPDVFNSTRSVAPPSTMSTARPSMGLMDSPTSLHKVAKASLSHPPFWPSRESMAFLPHLRVNTGHGVFCDLPNLPAIQAYSSRRRAMFPSRWSVRFLRGNAINLHFVSQALQSLV